jgi:hypothetical protein
MFLCAGMSIIEQADSDWVRSTNSVIFAVFRAFTLRELSLSKLDVVGSTPITRADGNPADA